MFPGKGAHLVLNDEILAFVQEALMDIANCYGDEIHDADPVAVINGLVDGAGHANNTWIEEKDNFGHKAFTVMPYKKGELRVTIVLTKQNELRLDIREWFERGEG